MKIISFADGAITKVTEPLQGSEYQGLFDYFPDLYRVLNNWPENKMGHAVVTDTVFHTVDMYFTIREV